MTWFGRLLGLIVAFSGFAAAHVLVQSGGAQVPPLPPLPTVSVTVPTLPVPPPSTPAPTVPVPSVPAPTLPVPVPSTPAPTVPVPVPTQPPPSTQPPVRLPPPPTPPATRPAPAPRPTQPATTTTVAASSGQPAAGTAAPPQSGSTFTPSTSSATQSGAAAPNETARPAGTSRTFQAQPHRTPRRVSVRLAFVLPKADRIFLIVRGPAPSCKIAGYIPVRGRKGVNRVYFAGRVHGRQLDPGVYLISLSPNRRLVPGAPTEYVRVVSQRRSQPLPDSARKPSCREAGALAADSTAGIPLAGALPSLPTPTVRPAPAQPAASLNEERDDGAAGLLPDAGVLGAATDEAAEEPFLAIAVLSLVAALLIAMVALVTRFLRGSWNP